MELMELSLTIQKKFKKFANLKIFPGFRYAATNSYNGLTILSSFKPLNTFRV